MLQYGPVLQLLALVQYSAQAHACLTHAMIELRLLPVFELLHVLCPDSWQLWPDPWLTDCELD